MTARSCGECSACCEATPVVPLGKPANTRCKFQRDGLHGCSAYETRPRCCAICRCAWLAGEDGDEADRPDRSGVIAEVGHDEHGRPFLVTLVPAPGCSEAGAGFVAAVARWQARGAAVATPTTVYATVAQLAALRNVRFVFADGAVVEGSAID